MRSMWALMVVAVVGCGGRDGEPTYYAAGKWHGAHADRAPEVEQHAELAIGELHERRPQYTHLYRLKELSRELGPSFGRILAQGGLDEQLRNAIAVHRSDYVPMSEQPPAILDDPMWGAPPSQVATRTKARANPKADDAPCTKTADYDADTGEWSADPCAQPGKPKSEYERNVERRCEAHVAKLEGEDLDKALSYAELNSCADSTVARLKGRIDSMSCSDRATQLAQRNRLDKAVKTLDAPACRKERAEVAATLDAIVEAGSGASPCEWLAKVSAITAPSAGTHLKTLQLDRQRALAAQCLADGRRKLAQGNLEAGLLAIRNLDATQARYGVDPSPLFADLSAAVRTKPAATGRAARDARNLVRARDLATRAPWAALVASRLVERAGYQVKVTLPPSSTREAAMRDLLRVRTARVTGTPCGWAERSVKTVGQLADGALDIVATLSCDDNVRTITTVDDVPERSRTELVTQPRKDHKGLETKWVTTTTPAGKQRDTYTSKGESRTVIELRVTDLTTGETIESKLGFERKDNKQPGLEIERYVSQYLAPQFASKRGLALARQASQLTDADAQLDLASRALVLAGPEPAIVQLLERGFGKLDDGQKWPMF